MEKIEELRYKNELSNTHYRQHLMLKYGIRPLKQLLLTSRQRHKMGVNYHNTTLLRKTLHGWSILVYGIVEEKQQRADVLYNQILLRRYFASWKKVCYMIFINIMILN